MDDDSEHIELNRILSVLENPTRRKILRKLSTDANYPLQLSRELHISQQAIMKHLKVLEDAEFVVAYEEKSDLGGPPRKVYTPRKRYSIRIDIGPSTYDEKIYSYEEYGRVADGKSPAIGSYTETRVVVDGNVTGEMKSDIVGQLPAFTDPALEGFRKRLERSLEDDHGDRIIWELKNLIGDINRDIDQIENRRKRLLELRERAFQEANTLISDMTNDYLEKEIYSLFIKDSIEDLESLSELLNIRTKIVEDILEQLLQRYR